MANQAAFITSIKRNIFTIKKNREVGRAKDLSAPLYKRLQTGVHLFTHTTFFSKNVPFGDLTIKKSVPLHTVL